MQFKVSSDGGFKTIAAIFQCTSVRCIHTEEEFTEELLLKPLPDRKVLAHFHFTNSLPLLKIHGRHHKLFPKAIYQLASNIIFVDQPTGTGFSYNTDVCDLRYDEKGVSNDMYDFLQAFFEKHPEYAKNDFFITGESYAEH